MEDTKTEEHQDNTDVEKEPLVDKQTTTSKKRLIIEVDEIEDVSDIPVSDQLSESPMFPAGNGIKVTGHLREVKDKLSDKEEVPNSLPNGLLYDNISSDKLTKNKNYDSKDVSGYSNDAVYGDKKLQITYPKPAENNNATLSGGMIDIAFNAALKEGGAVSVPLYHSGINVIMKPVSDNEINDLEVAIATDQIELGKKTAGLIFSNYGIVATSKIVNFFLSKVTSSSMKINSYMDLKKYILIQDINGIVSALISSAFSSGMPYTMACKNSLILEGDSKKCNSIFKLRVSPKDMYIVDMDQLSEKHRDHMAVKEDGEKSVESVLEYQRTLDANREKTIVAELATGKKITIVLRNTNISHYVKNGARVVDGIIEAVERSITDEVSINEKNQYIENRGRLSVLSMYSHYIKSIFIEGYGKIDNSELKKDDDINKALENISEVESIYKSILKDINTYISDSTISSVAIPDFECPKCKESQTDEESDNSFRNFIVLNPIQTFLDLSTIKTLNNQMRDMNI